MEPKPSRASAVALWAGAQCVALVAAAAGYRVWPHHPDPPESLALAEMVAVQVIGAALLFPRLFADPIPLAAGVVLIAPFEQLAGVMAVAPQAVVLRSSLWVAIWVLGLSRWSRGRPERVGWAVTTATLLSVGGTLLYYGRAGAAAAAGLPYPDPARFGPLVSGVAQTVGGTPSVSAWSTVCLPLMLALACSICRFLTGLAAVPQSRS